MDNLKYGRTDGNGNIEFMGDLPFNYGKVGAGFWNFSDSELAKYYWYPIEETSTEKKEYQTISRIRELDSDNVIRNKDAVSNIPLDEYKSRKKQELKNNMNDRKRQGCSISLGFTVDCMQENRTDWQNNYSKMKINGDTETTIRDYNNNTRTLTFSEYETMMKELGVFIENLYNHKRQKDTDIDNTTSHSELYDLDLIFSTI